MATGGRHNSVNSLRVFCEWCTEEIEACSGVHGDWMHTRSRFEHCDGADRLAMPKLPSVDRVVFR